MDGVEIRARLSQKIRKKEVAIQKGLIYNLSTLGKSQSISCFKG